ncbi:MAG: AbrB/MazE/SpoVT family DNA-binding domain-containing protein [Candidatus Bathyarchaeota archaeon]|nr:AbrB/MazE/SpoVT family DNA-binding domain-containing protein [Candidatus Bathyarchaeota archaeon]MDH5495189.1 AbrB/MazE/SpoVT family DNA-binding domain-containing protein [Candidatus Bathyarchaeota archaeon]
MPVKRENIMEIIENFFKTKIDERGRIYIPKSVRQRFSIKLGERLYIKLENNHFSIYTATAIKKLQLTRKLSGKENVF